MTTFAQNFLQMQKELGKWLMDISKYIVTVVIISSLFADIDGVAMYLSGLVVSGLSLFIGLSLVKPNPTRNQEGHQSPTTDDAEETNN